MGVSTLVNSMKVVEKKLSHLQAGALFTVNDPDGREENAVDVCMVVSPENTCDINQENFLAVSLGTGELIVTSPAVAERTVYLLRQTGSALFEYIKEG